MLNYKSATLLSLPSLTSGKRSLLYVSLILTTMFFMSSSSFAAIVGTENFETDGKTGWDWNNSGTAQTWSGTYTLVTESGNTRAKVVNNQVFLNYSSNSSQLKSNTGTFAYSLDMQTPTGSDWGGLSLFDSSNESLFLGHGLTMLRYNSSGKNTSVETTGSYRGVNKTYAVVCNSTGIYAWAYDTSGATLNYTDLYKTPTLKIDDAGLSRGNTRIRMGTGGTAYFDNIKVAYSDSTTTTSKGDATSTASLTDIFGAVPTITCIKESFSGYSSGNLNGQYQRNLGQAPLTKWTARNSTTSSATISTSDNLTYTGWSSATGALKVSCSSSSNYNSESKMTLDSNVMADWGVLGTDGKIGGTGSTNNTLYYGFLVQRNGTTGDWCGGPQLFRDGYEVLGLTYRSTASTTNFGGFFHDSNHTHHLLHFSNDTIGTDTHLFVVKLTYGETADEALIYIDPDMSKAESEQNAVPYKLSDLTGVSNQDLSFDSIIFRGSNAWTYDEWRMAQSWWNISDYTITDVATAEKLTDKWTIDATNIRVSFTSERDGEKDADHSGELVMEKDGTIAVADGFNLTQSGVVSGSGKIEKIGDGTLTLTNANTYSGGTTISEGTVKLTGNGTLGSGATTIEKGGTLELNVVSGEKNLTDFLSNVHIIGGSTGTGKSTIVKSGNGDLKILTTAAGQVVADEFIVSSGRLDIKGYLDASLIVESGAVLSPGNSVGTLTIETSTTGTENKLTVKSGATLLVEIEADGETGMDKIVFDNDGDKIVDFQEGSILKLATIGGFTPKFGDDISETLFTNIPGVETALKNKTTTLSSYYYQINTNSDGSISVVVNPGAIPEPSTWALLILGFAGLMWYRRTGRIRFRKK